MLNDAAIRRMLHNEIRSDIVDAVIVDEALVFGAIADVVVPSVLHAFEIKSAVDDLRRFPKQAVALQSAFPLVTLVTVESHLAEARNVIGSSWGLWVASSGAGGDRIVRDRSAQPHDDVRPAWVLGALRASELRRIAIANGLPSSGSRNDVASVLLRRLGADACVRLAHAVLSAPTRWREIQGPWVQPILSAIETPLFPLPVR